MTTKTVVTPDPHYVPVAVHLHQIHVSWQCAGMKVRLTVIAAGLALVSGCATASEPVDAATDLNWEGAAFYVGTTQMICGPVAGVSVTRGKDTFVNIGRDYPDPDRFTFVIFDQEASDYDRAKLDGNVCATGLVKLYEGSAQMPLVSLSDITPMDAP